MASPLAHPRVGFVVAKYGRSSVARNRLKRRLREITRLYLLQQLPVTDLVIRSTPAAYGASFEGLVSELVRAAEQLRATFGQNAE
jgi:ribonuclease P protein component